MQKSYASRGIWLLVAAGIFSFFLVPLDGQGVIAILCSWFLLFVAHGYRRCSHVAVIAFGIMTSLYALALVASLLFSMWLRPLGLVPLFSLGRWTELWLFLSLIGVATFHYDQKGRLAFLRLFRSRLVVIFCSVFLFITISSVFSGLVQHKAKARLVHSSTLESDSDRRAVKVPLDKMVRLDIADTGELLIDFTDLKERRADYRWCWKTVRSEDNYGTGCVFEYVNRFGCIQTVNSERSQTIIHAGGVGVQWSYCDSTSTWIYIHPSRTTARLLPDDKFPSSGARHGQAAKIENSHSPGAEEQDQCR